MPGPSLLVSGAPSCRCFSPEKPCPVPSQGPRDEAATPRKGRTLSPAVAALTLIPQHCGVPERLRALFTLGLKHNHVLSLSGQVGVQRPSLPGLPTPRCCRSLQALPNSELGPHVPLPSVPTGPWVLTGGLAASGASQDPRNQHGRDPGPSTHSSALPPPHWDALSFSEHQKHGCCLCTCVCVLCLHASVWGCICVCTCACAVHVCVCIQYTHVYTFMWAHAHTCVYVGI